MTWLCKNLSCRATNTDSSLPWKQKCQKCGLRKTAAFTTTPEQSSQPIAQPSEPKKEESQEEPTPPAPVLPEATVKPPVGLGERLLENQRVILGNQLVIHQAIIALRDRVEELHAGSDEEEDGDGEPVVLQGTLLPLPHKKKIGRPKKHKRHKEERL